MTPFSHFVYAPSCTRGRAQSHPWCERPFGQTHVHTNLLAPSGA